MKTNAAMILVLLVLFVGIGTEFMPTTRNAEGAQVCQDILMRAECEPGSCLSDCVTKHGAKATGVCRPYLVPACVCSYPC